MNNNKLKSKAYWYIKRLLDIMFSLIMIIITLPLMLTTLIILILTLGFPIFNQRRYREGLYKKEYLMYKLRKKKMNSDNLPRRERYTNVSYLIDKLKLNELPQLFNILIGDMSFVGPRPFIPNDNLPEGKINDKRYYVRPRLTSLAFVTKDGMLTHKQKLLYDIKYYDNFGFKQDFLIIIKTPIFIIKRLKK